MKRHCMHYFCTCEKDSVNCLSTCIGTYFSLDSGFAPDFTPRRGERGKRGKRGRGRGSGRQSGRWGMGDGEVSVMIATAHVCTLPSHLYHVCCSHAPQKKQTFIAVWYTLSARLPPDVTNSPPLCMPVATRPPKHQRLEHSVIEGQRH